MLKSISSSTKRSLDKETSYQLRREYLNNAFNEHLAENRTICNLTVHDMPGKRLRKPTQFCFKETPITFPQPQASSLQNLSAC